MSRACRINQPHPTNLCAVMPPAYEMLDPALSLSVGQTMALIFPPDNPGQPGLHQPGASSREVGRRP